MARIAYDHTDAAAFASTRHLGDDGAGQWRAAVKRVLDPRPGMRLLDLGAGTGSWSRAFSDWFPGIDVTAVEPSPAMRERSVHQPVLAGDAAPSVGQVEAAFAGEGFATVSLEQVPQITAVSLRQAADGLRREAHTPLQLITDEEYSAGVERLRHAALTDTGPVIDALDLLVLRRDGSSTHE
ncbi:SAM-dependent methyltransferase [Actinoplanes campanulatus]|uniref:SAM-dependent methyltransferase n=1 Tax=Actinoplanes campanulatus TaxID=113559 RepID=A0A7W5ARD3_9ACTN|nr:methyltransferase domain-containing protein [Actinoplanes campanulatus]MBB3101041.1 SAM-dependent methyltransferase [Actinoplanes campanulatus]GGN49356.1 hypothetical protein GCM10010109_87340 [Actinoplanes campanulatus]GID41867.1 hypothetical protein Aca09nite_83730 [Actinoplanes campanulatus]